MRGPVPPIQIYIHVPLHRLGGIAGNHFNQPYRVTDGVKHLSESTDTYALLETLCESPRVARLCVAVVLSHKTGLAQYSAFVPSKFISLTKAFLFVSIASLDMPAFTICLCDL